MKTYTLTLTADELGRLEYNSYCAVNEAEPTKEDLSIYDKVSQLFKAMENEGK